MRRLLPLFLLLFTLPALAGLFDDPTPRGVIDEAPLNNSADFLPVREAFRLSLVESSANTVKLRFVNAEGYYLYRHRFQFRIEPSDLARGEAVLPAGEPKHDEFFGDVEVYYGITDVELPIDNPIDLPFTVHVTYQGCADKGLCYPPETERIEVDGKGAAPTTAAESSAGAPAPGGWTWKELALFFIGGLGLALTPCVLPMLPILTGVVLRGQPGGVRGLVLSLAYVLPMAISFAILGALMGLFGAELNLQARLQSPWVLVPFAIFFGLFGAASLGFLELRLPAAVDGPLQRLSQRLQGGTLLSAAALGVLSSLLVSPCVSAPLAGALLYISASGDALGGGLKLLALGLGMGTPLVLFAVGGGALLPKSGPWMITVRNAFGALLMAVSVWLLERVVPGPVALALWGLLAAGVALWLGVLELTPKTHHQKVAQLLGLPLLVYAVMAWIGALQGESDPLRPLGHGAAVIGAPVQAAESQWQTITTPAELETALAAAKNAGQPLLLDWYADWCISCKVIEREVLAAPEVTARLGGYRLVRFDITESSAEQRALLDRYQLFGPPAILFFAGNGDEWKDLRVVGEINAADFAERLGSATARQN
ncbi:MULTISPECIES: protein-disulfide reductase DsbD [unclassified Pseudomonas]|uniref:protein-disulfide reductase DsbD n=1 Tax=unclassified Pseudomonas TaxID=196821 RepID=UPI00244B48F9|nr:MULTISPECIES: protein-disulfide reductase DsbD [unclassified Pseudomonas]MDG9928599.1 protein-disulfide reductase DsbD [Pseudomonas sp. GD04042]MDH0482769.1 protein-disulfide reductase DsbD [Pseudomonas sp. GD04015]MDH0607129.1 protein-disulfide reductase DsbD [Pseudomonas sp. GD03869]